MEASAQQYHRMIWLLPWDEDAHVRHLPWATWSLIALNVLVFLFAPANEAWFLRWGLVPAEAQWYQFLTSCFMHADVWHLVGNMLFLLVFGDNVEDAFGPVPFLLLYFGGGLLGDLIWVTANPAMTVPGVGASGCISALAGAYGVLFFSSNIHVKVMLVVFPIESFEIGAIWVLLFWFGADVFLTFYTQGQMANEGGVNFVAHGIGFVAGFVVALVAVMVGVLRRYDELADGDAWFGYWPPGLVERERTRARLAVKISQAAGERRTWGDP